LRDSENRKVRIRRILKEQPLRAQRKIIAAALPRDFLGRHRKARSEVDDGLHPDPRLERDVDVVPGPDIFSPIVCIGGIVIAGNRAAEGAETADAGLDVVVGLGDIDCGE
jgi:hypothetical protein